MVGASDLDILSGYRPLSHPKTLMASLVFCLSTRSMSRSGVGSWRPSQHSPSSFRILGRSLGVALDWEECRVDGLLQTAIVFVFDIYDGLLRVHFSG